MLLIWHGLGWLTFVIFGIAGLFPFLLPQFGDRASAASYFLSAIACWFLGVWLKDNYTRKIRDPKTGSVVKARQPKHCAFFIPMHFWGLIFFGLGIFVLFAPASDSPEFSAEDKTYTSPTGDFSIVAPGWISEKFEAEQTALGQVEKSRFFTVSNGIHFEVQRWNYPSKVFESISEDEILDGEISAVAGLVGGSVADKKVVIINSHRGREGRIQNHSGGKNLIFVRVFVEKSTTYRLIIISPTPNSERASVSTFLNSFRLN